jgi:uncharacterized membrane protein YccF (DUF307 family)
MILINILELLFGMVFLGIGYTCSMIIFLVLVIITLIISIFAFPRYVILDYGQISIIYIHKKKDYGYSDVQSFEIDDLIKTIKLNIIGRKAPIEFFYSDEELDEIRRTFGKYRIKRRFSGKEERKNSK